MSGSDYLDPSVRKLRFLRDEHNKQRTRVTIGKNSVPTWIWSSIYTLTEFCPDKFRDISEPVTRKNIIDAVEKANQLLTGTRTLTLILDDR